MPAIAAAHVEVEKSIDPSAFATSDLKTDSGAQDCNATSTSRATRKERKKEGSGQRF